MIRVKRIDHIGIAVQGIAEALPAYELLGLQLAETEDLPDRGLKIGFLPAGETELELLEPTDPESAVGKFLAKKGEGVHHICLAVEDIDGAVQELIAAGVRMIDQAPRPGGRGCRVAFIHPSATRGVLVELLGE